MRSRRWWLGKTTALLCAVMTVTQRNGALDCRPRMFIQGIITIHSLMLASSLANGAYYSMSGVLVRKKGQPHRNVSQSYRERGGRGRRERASERGESG